ncbi:MAG: type B DNA-directed DNA polymerase [Halobacteriaceae archaeon]
MPIAVEIRDGGVVTWHRTADGVRVERDADYRPTLYVDAPERVRADLRAALSDDPKVAAASTARRYVDLHADERTPVLRIDCDRPGEVRTLARELRGHREREYAPGTIRCFNVDFAPGFRYCVETGTPAVASDPPRSLRTLSLGVDEAALADRDLGGLHVGGDPVAGDEGAVLRALAHRLDRTDPDVLVLDTAELVPLIHDRAAACGVDCHLGRLPGHDVLAGANTFESYGRTGHSPARYDVPGRAIVDRANSFLWDEGGLPGLLDLAERSWRPLQETAWGSIGTVLTSIQSREALDRDVLVPWNKWEPEAFKDLSTLHAADRGGFTFAPEVGRHEDVVEVDFASLYPNVIRKHNVSPETVRCDCHDRADVPELGYSVCDDRGFLPDVLAPLVEDRAGYKARDDPEAAAKADALKWILVSCFGYQGYRNAKFGRIECHEAINAFAREILLDAKSEIEARGWRVLHGIVDSLWLTPASDPDPIADVTAAVTERVAIPLEHEATYDWVCFAPRRERPGGALTRYFGAREDGSLKVRGIECRQRSTPPFVADAQRDLLDVLDATADPAAVCDRLAEHRRRLRAGDVPATELVVTRRASKRADEYDRETPVVGALRRAADRGIETHPGESVRYVHVADAGAPAERVRLPVEDGATDYAVAPYERSLLRAAESVVSPLGWDESDVRAHLRGERDATLAAYREP